MQGKGMDLNTESSGLCQPVLHKSLCLCAEWHMHDLASGPRGCMSCKAPTFSAGRPYAAYLQQMPCKQPQEHKLGPAPELLERTASKAQLQTRLVKPIWVLTRQHVPRKSQIDLVMVVSQLRSNANTIPIMNQQGCVILSR